jgi:beta-lactamase regulating signal transducer with metallopeptidase domain
MITFCSAAINGAILSAVLTLAVWLALQVTRRPLNAATRHAIWWIVLVVTLALPLFCMMPFDAKSSPRRHATTAVIQHAALEIGPVGAPLVPLVAATSTGANSQRESIACSFSLPVQIVVSASQWQRPILIFWIVGSAALLLRVVMSYAALYRRSARAADAPAELNGRVEGWLARSGAIRSGVRLALSDEIRIPIATGPFRPAILIPGRLFDQLSNCDLEQIGLHEATHLARRDDRMLLIQRIAEALFALHPVVRWLTRQIDLEREIACDDIVAASKEDARSYADCLIRMVAACGVVRASLAAANVADSRSHLSRRVALLLDGSRNGRAQLLTGRCMLVALALVGAGGLLARSPLLVAFAAKAVDSLLAPAATETSISRSIQPTENVTPPSKPAGSRHRLLIAQATQADRRAAELSAPPTRPAINAPRQEYILGRMML